jgi:hypothetical protein
LSIFIVSGFSFVHKVVSQVTKMSRKFQLTEDQEFELIMSITGKRTKEHVPPVVLVVPRVNDIEQQVVGKATVIVRTPAATVGNVTTSSKPAVDFGAMLKRHSIFSPSRPTSSHSTQPIQTSSSQPQSQPHDHDGIVKDKVLSPAVIKERSFVGEQQRKPSFDDEFFAVL